MLTGVVSLRNWFRLCILTEPGVSVVVVCVCVRVGVCVCVGGVGGGADLLDLHLSDVHDLTGNA
jgi:hypothetical protein